MRKHLLLVAGAVALALPASALAAGPTLSSWAKSANAICKKTNDDIEKIAEPKTEKELVSALEKLVKIGRRQAEQLGKLAKPSSDAKRIGKLVGFYQQETVLAADLAKAAKAGDRNKMQKLIDQGNAVDEEADKLARSLGAKTCTE